MMGCTEVLAGGTMNCVFAVGRLLLVLGTMNCAVVVGGAVCVGGALRAGLMTHNC